MARTEVKGKGVRWGWEEANKSGWGWTVKGLECHAELEFHSAGTGVSKPFKQGHGSSRVTEVGMAGREGTSMNARTPKPSR